MKKASFQIDEARNLLVSKKNSSNPVSNRRQFLRTLGLGVLAVNPAIGAVKKISESSFSVEEGDHFLKFWKDNKLIWQISPEIFDAKTSINIQSFDNGWYFQIDDLQFKSLDWKFNLQGNITKELGKWYIKMSCPEWNWSAESDFNDFTEFVTPLTNVAHIETIILNHANEGKIELNNDFQTQFLPNWEINLQGKDAVNWNIFNNRLTSNSLKIKNNISTEFSFFSGEINGSLIQMEDFSDWNKFITQYRHGKKNLIESTTENPTLNLITGKADNKEIQFLFTHSEGQSLEIKNFVKNPFKIQDYFFFQELDADESPFYLSGRLETQGQWINNNLGSFKLIRNNEKPDFEIVGQNTKANEVIIQPRLKAFQPKITEGLISTAILSHTPVVLINKKTDATFKSQYFYEPPQDTTRNKNVIKGRNITPVKVDNKVVVPEKKEEKTPVREVQTDKTKDVKIDAIKDVNIDKVSEIQFENSRKINFVPRLPMNIKILRPDDLIWMDIQFKNFKFVSKNNTTHLELDDKSKPGIVTYYLPTQHTLEEAYYEKTEMDTQNSSPVVLPARHIRAKKSRLVYEYDAGKPSFEFSLHELLDWSKFTLKVHPRAYVQLPAIITVATDKPITASKKDLINTQNLNTKNNYYNTQIVEKSKNRINKNSVYDKSVIQAVIPEKMATTLEPSFNVGALIQSMKPGPVSEQFTSIEAPALMDISPNQINDFSHKIDLELKETESIPVAKSNITLKQVRPLQTNNRPILVNNKGQITELWHTSMGIKLRNNQVALRGMDKLKTIRALWAFDANENPEIGGGIDQPFLASLDASNRHKLVHTTSNYTIKDFTPIPVPVKKLMLTGLGAYIDWHAFFKVTGNASNYLNIIEWEHLATLGRDHYVKVVMEGYLFPLRHKAALVKITERKFDTDTKAAINRVRMFIVLLEKEVLYNRNDPTNKFIEFPFQSIKIENDYTPNINKPVNIGSVDPSNSTYNFYIYANNAPFLFDITATDKEGNELRIKMPLAFVENQTARDKSKSEKMSTDYNAKNALNDINFNGQQVAYAPALVDGDTTFETKKLKFGGMYYAASGTTDVKFHPIMQKADVFIQAIDEITGKREAASIELTDDNNQGMVFAKVSGAQLDFSSGSDKSGGFMMPNMSISGLSKLQGPIGGKIEDMMNLNFFPSEFFKALDNLPTAKIFGVIDVISLLLDKPDIGNSIKNLVTQIQKFKDEVEKLKDEILLLQQKAKETGELLTSTIDEKKALLKSKAVELLNTLNNQMPKVPNLKTWFTTEAFFAEYKWIPDFKNSDITLFGDLLKFHVDKPKEALQITTTFTKPFDGLTSAKLEGKAELNKFNIQIKDALMVNFNQMKFITGSSKKTDVKVDLDKSKPIEFVGALSFVNNLQSLIPSTGFSDDGPYVNLTLAGVKAGFNLSIPDVEVGVFALTNITLGAYVNLPFNGDELTLGFNFCTRENPFLLTVSGFGGGGYFLMITTLKGLRSVEAAFEFGASVSLNLGVASGGVSIMGGFYFKYEIVKEKETINLTGYIRINGRMSILGIISISLEFYLALNAVYETVTLSNGSEQLKVTKMEGVATLKVKIEILFFSKTVKVTVRREFAGADADPTFAQMVLPEDWNEYCLAFA